MKFLGTFQLNEIVFILLEMLVNMSCGWGIFFLSRCDWCRSPVRPDESPWPSGGINHGAHTPSLECREQVAAGVNYYSRLAHFGFWTERGNFPCVLSTSFFQNPNHLVILMNSFLGKRELFQFATTGPVIIVIIRF